MLSGLVENNNDRLRDAVFDFVVVDDGAGGWVRDT